MLHSVRSTIVGVSYCQCLLLTNRPCGYAAKRVKAHDVPDAPLGGIGLTWRGNSIYERVAECKDARDKGRQGGR